MAHDMLLLPGMSRAQGIAPEASAPAAEFVDGRIYNDTEEMRQINEAAAAKGYILVCDRCNDLTEPVVAVIAMLEAREAFGFCGECYREISREFLGHVV